MVDFNCQLGCSNKDYLDRISDLYNSIIISIEIAVAEYRRRRVKNNKSKLIPGWNKNIKSLYDNARLNYLDWLNNGRPRNHVSFDNMKISRSEFKRMLKYCKDSVNEQMLLSINEKCKNNDVKDFWMEVCKRRGNAKTVGVIDGIVDPNEVIKIFKVSL